MAAAAISFADFVQACKDHDFAQMEQAIVYHDGNRKLMLDGELCSVDRQADIIVLFDQLPNETVDWLLDKEVFSVELTRSPGNPLHVVEYDQDEDDHEAFVTGSILLAKLQDMISGLFCFTGDFPLYPDCDCPPASDDQEQENAQIILALIDYIGRANPALLRECRVADGSVCTLITNLLSGSSSNVIINSIYNKLLEYEVDPVTSQACAFCIEDPDSDYCNCHTNLFYAVNHGYFHVCNSLWNRMNEEQKRECQEEIYDKETDATAINHLLACSISRIYDHRHNIRNKDDDESIEDVAYYERYYMWREQWLLQWLLEHNFDPSDTTDDDMNAMDFVIWLSSIDQGYLRIQESGFWQTLTAQYPGLQPALDDDARGEVIIPPLCWVIQELNDGIDASYYLTEIMKRGFSYLTEHACEACDDDHIDGNLLDNLDQIDEFNRRFVVQFIHDHHHEFGLEIPADYQYLFD